MIRQIQDLVQFYAQKYHVTIELATEQSQLDYWTHETILTGLPSASGMGKEIEGMTFSHHPKLGMELGGELVAVYDLPMARVGNDFLLLLFLPTNQQAWILARTLIDKYIPKLCRTHRRGLRDKLIECITGCLEERTTELQSSIREDGYELERNSIELMTLARKLETDRQILRMFEKSPEWIKARSVRTFVDLLKLVPATYSSIRVEEGCVIGETHPVEIVFDDFTYHFESYTVEVELRKGKVKISGGTEMNGFVHPHVKDDPTDICFGNIGHLVSRLTGELDLFGLFTLVNQFLHSYNDNDPFQRIEKWDPDWVGEDEDNDPYCSFCDGYGHEIEHCESCWWCEYCQRYDDHDEEDCPNRPKDEEEESDAVAEEA